MVITVTSSIVKVITVFFIEILLYPQCFLPVWLKCGFENWLGGSGGPPGGGGGPPGGGGIPGAGGIPGGGGGGGGPGGGGGGGAAFPGMGGPPNAATEHIKLETMS